MSSTGYLSELDLLRSQVADLERKLAERDRVAQDLREHSDLLRAIVEGTAAETGEEFFAALVTHLTSVLKVQYAIIGEVQGDGTKKIRTHAVSAGGTLVDNFEYDLAHTPCATTLAQTYACFDRDIQATFPQFRRLAELGAQSYCAVSLRDKDGTVVGLLVVMDTKPLQSGDDLQSLLNVFAPRIAVEFERRRAEQERNQALADLHNVIEAIPDIVFVLDTQGNLVKWNHCLKEVTGYSPEELLNKPALDFVPPEEQANTAAAIQRAFTEGYAELEGYLLTKDHRLVPYHWTGALLKNPQGEPIGIAGIGRDVSDKKRAEIALRESEERLALAVEGSTDILWDAHRLPGEPWYAPQTQIWWSPRVRKLLGLQESDLFETLEQWAARLHPDDKDRVFGQLTAHMEHRVPYDVEYRLRHNRGDYLWILGRGQALWDEQGEPRRMSGSCQDITERKRAEEALAHLTATLEQQVSEQTEALRVSETRFRQFFDHAPNVTFLKTSSGHYLYTNRQFEKVFGLSPGGAMGKTDAELFSPQQASQFHMHDQQVLASGQAQEFEETIQHEDGPHTYIVMKFPLSDASGRQTAIGGIATDITQRKRTQEQLALYREIFAQSIDGIAVIDLQGRYLEQNMAHEQMLGYSHDLLADKTPAVHLGEEAFARVGRELAVSGVYSGELQSRTARGESLTINLDAFVVKDTERIPLCYVGIKRDITGRKLAEEALAHFAATLEQQVSERTEALRVSEERYARATAIGRVGVWELDVATGTYYGDVNLKALFGYTKDELSTDPYVWLNLVHPDDQTIALDHWQRIVSGEIDDYNYELRMLKRDGTIIWTDVRGHAIRDHEGQITYLFGATVDITERKQVQEALAQSEHQLRTVLDALPVGVWFTDRVGKPLLANPAAKQIWSNIKQIGLQTGNNQAGWWETVGSANEPHRWALGHVLATGVASLNETFDFECLDGTKKVIRNSTVPVQDETGNILGTIVLNEDITMLRQAQEALRLTQFSVDHAVEGFFWIGPDARILHVNEAACRMLEYTSEELTAMTVPDIDPNFPLEAWSAQWEELNEKGSLTFESKYWSRTGRVLDMEITVNYLQYEGKEYNCAIMRDIAERKRAEAALRASEERYRSLYDETPTMYFTLATDGTVLSVNRFGAEQLGFSVEELVGHSVLRLFYESDKEAVAASLSECLATPETTRYWEIRKLRKDGSMIWVREAARVGRSTTEEAVVLVTCQDITARKQAEEALLVSENRLNLATRGSNTGVWDWDLETNKVYFSPIWKSMLGYEEHELRGEFSEWDERIHPDDLARARVTVRAYLDGATPQYELEHRLRHKDGSYRWILARGVILSDAQGVPYRMAGFHIDITERKRMEEALRQREHDLRVAIEERERISQDLHDGILQSLFAVGLALESAQLAMPPRIRKTSGGSLNQAIDQLNRVMREIRNFIAGLGSDLLEGKDLSMALQHMLALLTQNQATRVRLAVEDRAAKAVSAEQSLHLARVIQEAVSNCIKHSRAQEARVSLKMLKQGVRLSIRDNGRGFNQNDVKRTGHGLTNMAARAQKIGGRLTVLSKKNEGTSIVLDLPKEAADVSH